jgi:Trypsin-co-occurring domain 2
MVVSDPSGLMELSTALEGLREELANAWEEGASKALRFRVSGVTLTLEAVARRETGGTGKIRWWLVEAGGGVTAGSKATQTLVLTLTPGLYDAHGNAGPLDVSAEQSQPAG